MLPTVTIESTRHLVSTFDMGALVGTVIVIVAVAWMMMHARHHRHR